MSITAYTGLPGHGKSYSVVENVIIPALKNKRKVYTNIPLNEDLCLNEFAMTAVVYDIQNIIDDPEYFTSHVESGCIFVIDEVWRLWPAGVKTNAIPETHKAFLAEHRHDVGENGLSTEIVLVTQDLSQIANFARILVENTFHVVKHTKVGMSKAYRMDVYYGAITGNNPPVSKRVRQIHGKYKNNVTRIYKSHTKSKTGEAGDESRTDKRFSILSGMRLKSLVAGTLIFIILSIYFTNKFISESDYTKSMRETETTQPEVKKVPIVSQADIEAKQRIDELKQLEEKRIEKQEKLKKDLLNQSEYIEISFNNGYFPDIQYVFSVVFNGDSIPLTLSVIESLGYTVKPITECLVHIHNEIYSAFARCYPEKEKTNFITELTS